MKYLILVFQLLSFHLPFCNFQILHFLLFKDQSSVFFVLHCLHISTGLKHWTRAPRQSGRRVRRGVRRRRMADGRTKAAVTAKSRGASGQTPLNHVRTLTGWLSARKPCLLLDPKMPRQQWSQLMPRHCCGGDPPADGNILWRIRDESWECYRYDTS